MSRRLTRPSRPSRTASLVPATFALAALLLAGCGGDEVPPPDQDATPSVGVEPSGDPEVSATADPQPTADVAAGPAVEDATAGELLDVVQARVGEQSEVTATFGEALVARLSLDGGDNALVEGPTSSDVQDAVAGFDLVALLDELGAAAANDADPADPADGAARTVAYSLDAGNPIDPVLLGGGPGPTTVDVAVDGTGLPVRMTVRRDVSTASVTFTDWS